VKVCGILRQMYNSLKPVLCHLPQKIKYEWLRPQDYLPARKLKDGKTKNQNLEKIEIIIPIYY